MSELTEQSEQSEQSEKPERTALTEDELQKLDHSVCLVVEAALAKKATAVVVLDVTGKADYTDRFVICSASSERQVRAIAQSVLGKLKEAGQPPLGVEGLGGGAWVLVDLGDVVFHAFHGAARGYYDLEGLWVDVPRISLEALGVEVPADEAADFDDDFLFDSHMAPLA